MPADEFTSTPVPAARGEGTRCGHPRSPVRRRRDRRSGSSTTLVAVSLVQMQTGRVANVAAILEAAERHGARVLVDATQGIPFVPLEAAIDRIDYLVCSGYKHLLSPARHGVLLRPTRSLGRPRAPQRQLALGRPAVRALLRWPADARPRRAALRRLARLVPVGRRDRLAAAAGRVARRRARSGRSATSPRVSRRRLDVPWYGSSLVCAPLADGEAARAALAAAGVRASVRGTAIRFAVHVYTDRTDLDRAADAIAPFTGAQPEARPTRRSREGGPHLLEEELDVGRPREAREDELDVLEAQLGERREVVDHRGRVAGERDRSRPRGAVPPRAARPRRRCRGTRRT